MNPIIRNVLAVIAGVVIGSFVNGEIIMLSGSVIAPPEGIDPNNMESIKAIIHLYQPVHFLFPFLAHALGTFAGALVAALIAASHKMSIAMLISLLYLAGGIYMVTQIPAPTWFAVSDLALAYLPVGWLAAKLAERKQMRSAGKLILLLFTGILFSACNPLNKFQSASPYEVKAVLSSWLPLNKIAPDDPALFDDSIHTGSSYCPELSEPFWLIPSADLPQDVKPQYSNNNVSISVFNNRLYVAFRTGPTHFASKKTGMYIISSADGSNWKKEMELFIGKDVREPFLIPIDGKLHFYCFAAGTKMTAFEPDFISHYYISDDGNWTGPENVLDKGEVHWSLLNRNGKTYLSSYEGSHYNLKGESKVSLNFKQTSNGKDFYPVGDSARVYFGGVSETAFEFDKEGNLWAVTRLEDGDKNGFGSQVVFADKNDWGNWQFPETTDLNCYMSPKMFRHGDDLYLIARKQMGKKPFGKANRNLSMKKQRIRNWVGFSLSPKTTALYRINQKERKVEWVMNLPGAGDTAFPSIQRLDKDLFLIANYSSPIKHRKKRSWLNGQLGHTGIYLQVISFTPCR